VAAQSKIGSMTKMMGRHKEPLELNRYAMGIESGGIGSAIDFLGLERCILLKRTSRGVLLESAAGRSFRF